MPVVVGGYVYVGGNNGRTVYQLNASNVSHVISSFSTLHGDFHATEVTVANGFAYIPTMDYSTFVNAKVYQVNASNISQLISTFDVLFRSLHVIASEDYVYFSSANVSSYSDPEYSDPETINYFYKVNASNISQVIQTFSTNHLLNLFSFDEDKIYVGGGVDMGPPEATHGILFVLNASNISQILQEETLDIAAPVIKNDFVYMPNDNSYRQLNASNISQELSSFPAGGYMGLSSQYGYLSSEKTLFQLNAFNISQEIHNFTAENNVGWYSFCDKYIYVIEQSEGSYVYQLNVTNVSQLIEKRLLISGHSGIALTKDYVYVTSPEGYIYQLNAANISLPN